MNTTSVDNAALLTTIDRVATAFSRLRGIKEGLVADSAASGIQFDEWDWEVGVGLYGFLRRAISANDQKALQELVVWYSGQIERGLPPRQINSTAPMLPLAILVQHVDRPDFRALVEDWAEWLVKELPKTEDGGFQHVVKERLNDGELWDDTLFMAGLFLAQAGVLCGRNDWIDEAVYQFVIHTRYLSDPVSGLWYHGWTFNGRHNFANAFWARGNAWITVAIPELFDLVSTLSEKDRRFLSNVLVSQVRSLKKYQRPDGMFTTLLDDPSSPLETSATAGIAYGMLRAIDAGILDKSDKVHAERALAAVLAEIDEEGVVHGVSDGTPMGHDLDFYRRIPNLPTPYGQALTMLLLTEVLIESGRRQ
ncbi:glycoside hydrolase family 88/105 protein [Rhizobium fabae]|uniref:Glycoside hydrolase family 105 protein n=1 Tax=Rhizobium fabae TaxID=573179 RepID=A0A7W6FKD5_9HYPH|nr:glycoside hydrolase family 88 protein [Rhizobium fabae]MBB3916774.1 unsaturated rhamnogalacturonyl hydrolase [Rhizobium fabae]RUM10815.1 glycoside hydrolase family 105 protein [Rhizobium fabae]